MASFGGDPNLITLVGHGTGASLVSLLLTSPVAQAKKGLSTNLELISPIFEKHNFFFGHLNKSSWTIIDCLDVWVSVKPN